MTKLLPIQTLGLTPAFFKLPPASYSYYTFDEGYDLIQMGHWDILAVHIDQNSPLRLTLRIMSIDEEIRDFDDDWSSWETASGHMSLTEHRMREIVTLMQTILTTDQSLSPIACADDFVPVSIEELSALGLPYEIMQRVLIYTTRQNFYYRPDREIADATSTLTIIGLGKWYINEFGSYTKGSMNIDTYTSQQLQQMAEEYNEYLTRLHNNSKVGFNTEFLRGTGEIVMDAQALQDFILLLKKML